MFTDKDIRKLIVPLMFEQLLAVSVGFVDTLMVSRAGEAAISGVALVDNINRLIVMIMSALATGGAVICSQYLGRQDKKSASKANAQLHMVMTLVACVLVVIILLFTRPILSAIFGSVEKDVLDNGVIYFTITAFSYPFLALYNAGAAVFRSQGNGKIGMNISLVMNVINVAANAILVIVFDFGVSGVALATLMSRVVAGIIMLVNAMSEKDVIYFRSFAELKPDMQIVSKILRIGIPSGIENGMFQIGKLMTVGMVATFGTASIAANAVGNTIIDFANIPGVAVGLSIITIVGQCVGAGDYDQAKLYTIKLTKLSYMGCWCANSLLFIFAPFVSSWFNLTDEGMGIAVTILRCFAVVAMCIWPLSFTVSNALRAVGDVNYAMVVSIVSMWTFRIASSYLLCVVLEWGVLGVWCGMFIDWAARSICFVARFVGGRWRAVKPVI